ncbi:hypothetical protein ACFWIJ_45140, partial [Streptomyces sp. NPDC127079]
MDGRERQGASAAPGSATARRRFLGLCAGVGLGTAAACERAAPARRPAAPDTRLPQAERERPGPPDWRIGSHGA